MKKVHIIGIGGIGTSALARWFLSQGWKVSGSDLNSSKITRKLSSEGVRVFIGHKPQNLPTALNLAVYSAALTQDNPEIKKLAKLGVPRKSYAQALGNLTKIYPKTVAVAGAHGKSTSASILSLILVKAGFDPTVIVGTNLKEFENKNFRKGKSDYLVLEADEYLSHFLNHFPFAAIITNIDREHLDYFKDLNEIKKTFLGFIMNIRPGGIAVLNKDNQNLFSLKSEIEKIAKKHKLKILWYSLHSPSLQKIRRHIKKLIKIPGEHNVSNCLGIYVLSCALGIKDKDIFSIISSYKGAWRRMEYRGDLKFKNQISKIKIKVYDDYAHHPTEIRATLSGIAEKWPNKLLICVFQPHQAKRLASLFNEFTGAFDAVNILILLDIYRVPGRDTSTPLSASKVSQNVGSLKLLEGIQKHLNNNKSSRLQELLHIPYSKNLAGDLKKILLSLIKENKKSAIIIMMGAGDIVKYTDQLIQ